MFRSFAVLAAISLSTAVSAKEGYKVNIGKNSPALHVPVGKQIVSVTPAFEDYS